MDPIPRIPHLDIEIKKYAVKLQELQNQILEVKSQLSRHRDIFVLNFRELDFASTIPFTGKVYASFRVKKKKFDDYCRRKGIVAQIDPLFEPYEYLEEAAGQATDIPIMHESDRFDFVKDMGYTRLMIDRQNEDAVAVKYIERGDTIDQNLFTEIIDHRCLKHPNIVRFKEVILTPTHLAIVMEHATEGELHDRLSNKGRFHENKARYLFQQLIYAVSCCHSKQLCHRNLKLENILLDGSLEPRLKICYFDYSKSSLLNSLPNDRVGRPIYIPPELITNREYDIKAADVLSCGVTLYEMLVGAYPFRVYSKEPRNLREAIRRITDVRYSFPEDVNISVACRDLISRILVQDPAQRITMPGIKNHEWFLKDLPVDLVDEETMGNQSEEPMQSLEVIMQIISEAKTPIQTNQT